MCGNFGIKTKDVKTVDTVNAAGVGNSIYCFYFWRPAKPAVSNNPLHPWWWFVGGIMFNKPYPAVPMTAYKKKIFNPVFPPKCPVMLIVCHF